MVIDDKINVFEKNRLVLSQCRSSYKIVLSNWYLLQLLRPIEAIMNLSQTPREDFYISYIILVISFRCLLGNFFQTSRQFSMGAFRVGAELFP